MQIFQELKELEEKKSKEALELLGQKHKLENSRKKGNAPGWRAASGRRWIGWRQA